MRLIYQIQNSWKSFEQHPKISWLFSFLWLSLIGFFAFLWNLGATGLVDETEPLFAEAARQMAETGDWITPYFNGETRFDKPPLVYWLMAIGYKVLGVNEWAVRLPSALAAIALMVMIFYTLKRYGFATPAMVKQGSGTRPQRQRWISAWLGSALVALNIQTLVWAHIGVSDMLLSGCMGCAILCFFLGYCQKQGGGGWFTWPRAWYLAFYILISLAVLTKGPVGVVIPGIVIIPFLLYVGRLWEVVKEAGLVVGSLIFSLITIPWFVLVSLRNPDYIDSFFGYHNFERFTDVVNNHSAPWYFYFLVVLVGFAPHSIYLPKAILRLQFWRPSFWRKQPRSAQLSLFALFWFTAIFLFFTVAVTKLPSYTLPLLPAASILVALLGSEELTKVRQQHQAKPSWSLLISNLINILFLCVLGAALFYGPNFIGYDPAAPNLGKLFEQSGIPIVGGMIWLVTALITCLLCWRSQLRSWIMGVNLLGFLAFLIFVIHPSSFLLDEARQLPLRQLSQQVIQVEKSGEDFYMVGFKKPSVAFYSQRPVKYFTHIEHLLPKLVTESSLSLLRNKAKHNEFMLMLSEPSSFKNINLQPQDYEEIGSEGSYDLIRVSKKVLISKITNN